MGMSDEKYMSVKYRERNRNKKKLFCKIQRFSKIKPSGMYMKVMEPPQGVTRDEKGSAVNKFRPDAIPSNALMHLLGPRKPNKFFIE